MAVFLYMKGKLLISISALVLAFTASCSNPTGPLLPTITIITQPVPARNVAAGNISGHLSVEASVTKGQLLSFQWFSNDTNSNDRGTAIDGATGTNFPIPTDLALWRIYYFFVEVSATGGAIPFRSDVTTVRVINPPSIEMVPVQGGNFELGWDLGDDRFHVAPVSFVTVDGFYISRHAITQGLFETVMGTNPSWFTGAQGRPPIGWEHERDLPVERVSWYDALVFSNRISIMKGLTPAYSIAGSTNPDDWGPVPTNRNEVWDAVKIILESNGYRLPTEAQWEFAAKGGVQAMHYSFSGSQHVTLVAWYVGNSEGRTRQVGTTITYNELGIFDMSGNVSEWVWDWYGPYTSDPKTNPTGPSMGFYRVLRGGNWASMYSHVRSVARISRAPWNRLNIDGFRVIRPQ